jgi:putative tricarboxylic transport membrane protein
MSGLGILRERGRKYEPMSGVRSKAELAAAIVLLIFSFIYVLSALHLKIGRLANPGPGLMPLLLGLALTACALIYLIQLLRGRPGQGAPVPQSDVRGWRVHLTPLGIVVPVFAYPFLLARLGFLIATSLVVYSILLLLKFKTPWLSLLVCVAMTTLCYLLFAKLLGVVLPDGPAESLLFTWF